MSKNGKILTIVGLLIALLVMAGPMATTAMAQPDWDLVLGQLDFTHDQINLVDAKGLNAPAAVALDTSASPNHVWVADSSNNRVLGWSNAESFANGAAATIVIGEPTFKDNDSNHGGLSASSLYNPSGVAVDAAGNLYVSDTNNSRVLEYTTPFIGGSNGMAANLVFGQPDFVSGGCNDGGLSATSLCDPTGVAVDGGGNLYVADNGEYPYYSGNSRVLEYYNPLALGGGTPGTPGSAGDNTADLVFGQADFVSNGCNNYGGLSATSLCYADGVAVDGAGNLYVADTWNSRVLEYSTPLTTGMTANLVFGQPDFVSSSCNNGGESATSLCYPTEAATDSAGDLYVADNGYYYYYYYYSNNRVLEYYTPLTPGGGTPGTPGSAGDTTADLVIGQPSFTSSGCNDGGLNASGLCNPLGVGLDGAGNLYVADNGNNRVLMYDATLTSSMAANSVLGQDDFAHNVANLVDGAGVNNAPGVAVDSAGNLYVADSNNHRVLGWSAASIATGAAADRVIGQSNFLDNSANEGGPVSASSLNYPTFVAVDAAGNLYVSDSGNNRVLEYTTPFIGGSNGMAANLVFGQYNSFTTGSPNIYGGGGAGRGHPE